MNLKAVIPLVLAVVFGLVAALLVKNAIARHSSPVSTSGNMVTVVVAKDGIDPGKALALTDLTTSKISADVTPSSVFSDPNALVGRVTQISLMKGQTILENLLAPAGTGSGLQALIPAGMRAVTLEVNEFSGVGGMLQPGCIIDIISVMHSEKNNESVARTVLQSIKITAVGRNTSTTPPADGTALPPTNQVTLLCTPKQAQVLELASMTGRPWLVLRSTRDGQILQTEGTTMAELRGDDTTDVASRTPTTPIAPITPVAPTTPVDPFGAGTTPIAKADPQPTTMKRYVEVLRGGAESKISFEVPIPTDSASNDTEPAFRD